MDENDTLTPQVVEMVAFITARLEETEYDAREAIGTSVWAKQTGRWVHRDVDDSEGSSLIVFAVAEDDARTQVADLTAAWEGPQRAVHIARHDPARVLAHVEATRKIVANACTALDHGWQLGDEAREATAHLAVRILQHLAGLDADHADYDQAWAL